MLLSRAARATLRVSQSLQKEVFSLGRIIAYDRATRLALAKNITSKSAELSEDQQNLDPSETVSELLSLVDDLLALQEEEEK